MLVKNIVDEDFVNFRLPSMVVAFPFCSFKCEKESGLNCCQNSPLTSSPNIEINPEDIVNRYLSNPISQALVCAGLEPFDSILDLSYLILKFRFNTKDPIVIYTGYTEEELSNGFFYKLNKNVSMRKEIYQTIIKQGNVIIKFGRYIPNQEGYFNEVLGVKLASPNQYAKTSELLCKEI